MRRPGTDGSIPALNGSFTLKESIASVSHDFDDLLILRSSWDGLLSTAPTNINKYQQAITSQCINTNPVPMLPATRTRSPPRQIKIIINWPQNLHEINWVTCETIHIFYSSFYLYSRNFFAYCLGLLPRFPEKPNKSFVSYHTKESLEFFIVSIFSTLNVLFCFKLLFSLVTPGGCVCSRKGVLTPSSLRFTLFQRFGYIRDPLVVIPDIMGQK